MRDPIRARMFLWFLFPGRKSAVSHDCVLNRYVASCAFGIAFTVTGALEAIAYLQATFLPMLVVGFCLWLGGAWLGARDCTRLHHAKRWRQRLGVRP